MSQALMIPIMSSCSLLLMFYHFSSVSQPLTAFTAVASALSLFFCLLPCVTFVKSQFGLVDPFVSRCCSKSFPRTQGMLLLACSGTVAAWLITGHWILNNLLGISICVAFYVIVSVATQQVSNNPVHTVANSLSLPGLQLITKKVELTVKIMFPGHLLGGVLPGTTAADFMMLDLGDMAIPAKLLALILCFDYRKNREIVSLMDLHSAKGQKYIWYSVAGYIVALITSLAAGVLTHSPQPALLYLVPSTLGPVILLSWMRRELSERWEGSPPSMNDKDNSAEV